MVRRTTRPVEEADIESATSKSIEHDDNDSADQEHSQEDGFCCDPPECCCTRDCCCHCKACQPFKDWFLFSAQLLSLANLCLSWYWYIPLILSALVEYIALYFGAKQSGASKWSQYGAIAGMVLGFVGLLPALPFGGPLIGVLFGAIIGAFVGEYAYRGNLEGSARTQQALKASAGIVIASLIGNIIEALLAALAVAIFIYSTWSYVFIS